MRVLKIKSVKIRGFGKFHNYQATFTDGVNIVFGPNESGKTTLYRFMVSALGGLTEDELSRYKPWDFDEFGGSLIIEGTAEEEITFQKPVLDRRYVESIGLLSDEEDVVELLKTDETVIARLKKKMAQLEEAERISTLLRRLPEFEERLLQIEKGIDEQIKSLEEQINDFKDNRHRLFALVREKSKMENTMKDLASQRERLLAHLEEINLKMTEQIEKIGDELDRKLRELTQELDLEKQLPIIDAESYTEIVQLHQKIESAQQRSEQLKNKVQELSQKRLEIEKQINEMKGELGWQEDIEKIRLRIKNFELSYRILEDKLEQLEKHKARYRQNWEIFKREGDRILRSLESEIPTSIELEMKQLNNKLQYTESEISKHRSRAKLERILSLVTLVFSAIAVGLGLLVNPMWFYTAAVAGSASGVLFFVFSRTMKKLEEEDEQRIKLQLEFRSVEKKKQAAVQRVLSTFGVNSLEELKESYEEYVKWLNESQQMEKLKERLSIEEGSLVSELHRFGARDIKDVPSLVLRLNELVENIERKQMEYFLIQQSIEQTKGDLEKTREDLSSIELLLSSKLSAFRAKDMRQLQLAFERNSKIEQLQHRMDQLLRVKEAFEQRNLIVLAQDYPQLADLMNQKKDLQDHLSDLSKQQEDLEQNMRRLQEQITKTDLTCDITSQINKLSLKKLEKQAYSKQRNQLTQVKELLENELDQLTGNYVERFSRLLKDLFSRFTELSENMLIEHDLSVRFFVRNQFLNMADSLSRATLDQLSLCYKIALYNTLQPQDPVPLIIDNFLIRFDETRLERAAQILKDESKQRQVIIFTSDEKLLRIFGSEPVLVLDTVRVP
ncbi:MAG TPA: AAA family ATPase [Pseudothermotoga sp.]|nr:AAA family ATPase [Pseudothermotoga sp.]HOK82974.1 AAA family ATPase [Pseudothermotoga sp.]HPP69857.1 AAA family ATPase [Pseudothermotoga sp.]